MLPCTHSEDELRTGLHIIDAALHVADQHPALTRAIRFFPAAQRERYLPFWLATTERLVARTPLDDAISCELAVVEANSTGCTKLLAREADPALEVPCSRGGRPARMGRGRTQRWRLRGSPGPRW